MRKPLSYEARYIQMTETPVGRLISHLAVPSIVSMLITSIYSMTDTYFVSQIGTSASGAVGIVFSLMAMIQAIGFMLGNGGGNYVSRLLGARENQEAQRVATTATVTAAIIGLLFTIFGLIFLPGFMRLMGATETILPYAQDYARYILIGSPYIAASFVLNNLLRSQGNSFQAMIGIGIGAVINIVLDPILIFTCHLGTAGAAIATIFGQLISFIVLLYQINSKTSIVHINLKYLCFKWRIYKEILRTGMPSFYRQGLAALSSVLMNVFAGPYGDAAIAAMSIVSRIYQFLYSALLGFGQAFQPVCGYNYGARLYSRVRESFWFCIKVAAVFLVTVGTLCFIFAPQIITLFRREDLEVIAIGTRALRFYCVALPTLALTIVCNMTSQSTGKGIYATIIALCQQGLFFIPLIVLLPRFIGILGVQASMPLANLLTFILAIYISARLLREFKLEDDPVTIEMVSYTEILEEE